MKRALLLFAAFSSLVVAGCGPKVQLPPAHVGKVLTSDGYQEGLKNPSSFRLPFEWVTDPKLVIAEVSDAAIEEEMVVYMPEDKLNLTFDVRGTFAITTDSGRIESIFDRVTAQNTEDTNIKRISFQQVYEVYAKQAVRRKAREVVAGYDIEQILANREQISREIETSVREELSDTPIECLQLGLADIQPPAVIVKAQEQRKEREIAIERAEAEKMIRLKELEAALEAAQKQQEIDLIDAETQLLYDQKVAEGVSDKFVIQRALRALDKIAERDNVIIVPMEALRNPAMLMGLTEQALKDLATKREANK